MIIKNKRQIKHPSVKRIILDKTSLKSFLSLLFYKVVLDIAYSYIISKVWSYSNFFSSLNFLKLAESYLLIGFLFLITPKKYKNISTFIIWLLIILSYVPLLTIYAFMDQPRSYVYAVTGFLTLVLLLIRMPTIRWPSLEAGQARALLYTIFVSLAGFFLFLFFKYLNFTFHFDLSKVYEIRDAYINLKIPLAGYIFTWMAHIVNPILFILFLKKRKFILLSLIILFQLLLFSNTGHKTFLFALPFVFILVSIMKRKNQFAWLCSGLASIVLIGIVAYYAVGDIWITSFFARRTLLVPAQLSFIYYDFFSQNEHTFLSQHGLFRNFIIYPYELTPPHLIGQTYFNSPEMGANNGIYGDAYMNFGFWGFAIWGIILGFILKLFDIFSQGKEKATIIAAVAMPAISLTNSALLTCLLTHGIALSLLIICLLPRTKRQPII